MRKTLQGADRIGELLGMFEGVLQSMAEFCRATVTFAVASSDAVNLETIRCCHPGLDIVHRQVALNWRIVGFLSKMHDTFREARLCRPNEFFMILGATAGGGFLLQSTTSRLSGTTDVHSALAISHKTPHRFSADVETVSSIVLQSLTTVVLAIHLGKPTERKPETYNHEGQRSKQRPPGASPSSEPVLSHRERQIASLLTQDLGFKEIAERLGLSRRTVEHYAERLKLQMGVATLHGLTTALITGSRSTADPQFRWLDRSSGVSRQRIL